MSKTATVMAQQPPAIPFHQIRPRPVKTPAHREVGKVYCLLQWKSELDNSEPWWKKLFFWLVYRPFNQFSRFVLKVPSYNGEDKDGKLWWFEFQGAVTDKWQAEQACRSRQWAYEGLNLNELLPDKTTTECVEYGVPLTDARTRERYERAGKPTIEVSRLDMVKLAAKISATDGLIENFHKAT